MKLLIQSAILAFALLAAVPICGFLMALVWPAEGSDSMQAIIFGVIGESIRAIITCYLYTQIRNNGKSLSHAIGFGMLCSALIGSLYLVVGVTSFEPKNPMRFLVADSLILLVQGFLTGIVLFYSRPKNDFMKNCIFFILLTVCCHAQKLDITKLTDDFYVFTTYKDYNGHPFPSNGMYVLTENGAVVIDSPWDTTQCQPLLDSIQKKHGKKVIMAIATHFHDDRTGAFDYFKSKGIETWSSEKTRDLCRKHNEKQAEFTFRKDTIFAFGKHPMKVFFPGEGHTKDNIAIWFPNDKILYGGCLVKSTESRSLGNLADANLKAYPKTIRKLIRDFSDAHLVIPGHQGWEGNPLQHTLELLRQ